MTELWDEFRTAGVITATGRLFPTPEDAAIFRTQLARILRDSAALDIERHMRALSNACGDYIELPTAVATSAYLNRRCRTLAEIEP